MSVGGGAHLPCLGLERVTGYITEVCDACSHCDARPTVTFPAAGHHRPLTKLYCLVTEARVCV